jgi:hypothetical protein
MTQTYKAEAGQNIKNAAQEAIALSKKLHDTVRFQFNDISLSVTEASSSQAIVDEYEEECRKSAEAYRKSPAGQRDAAQRKSEISGKQERLNQLAGKGLDSAIKGGLKTLIPWVKKYAEDADDIAVDYKGDVVLTKLAAAGYKAGECAGKDFVKGDKNIMGRYIVGQVMSCMEGKGPFGKMPPHPMAINFSKQYMAMPDPQKPKANRR